MRVLIVTLLVAAPVPASAEPPILVVRFTPQALEGDRVGVRVELELPDGTLRSRALTEVAGPCSVQPGGLESLAVLDCGARSFEIVQRRLRIDVDELDVRGRRQRLRSWRLLRARPGWLIVPRCREAAEDAHACWPGDRR